jgi:hypothetical protein
MKEIERCDFMIVRTAVEKDIWWPNGHQTNHITCCNDGTLYNASLMVNGVLSLVRRNQSTAAWWFCQRAERNSFSAANQ